MGKVKFIFCVHNHQPVGNFDWVFEKGYEVAYKPFMDVMLKHPKIKWSIHNSGMIWEFFENKHQDYIAKLKQLVSSEIVEVLSGGYYEPIVSQIPDRDKLGQINKMTSYIKNKFGSQNAKGMWLAERVWEPSMSKILSESKIEYSVLDDAHFAAAGMDIEKLNGYYTTEDQGFVFKIFPISQKMRYFIPFQNVENSINYFKHLVAKNPGNDTVVVMADDGEKFGMWPSTYKHVYENGWLNQFLQALEDNSDIVETATFSEILKSKQSSGIVYLPCSSYFEMSEWSLPSVERQSFESVLYRYGGDGEAKRFLRGGFWRNFLSKYEEANNMHKKMLYISTKVENYCNSQKPNVQDALDNLFAGQCNCAYWHGVFGGLYLPHLRNAVYNRLLKAENICNESSLKKASWKVFDFNCDSKDEYIFESEYQNFYISLANGGSLFEWDILKIEHNILNVLTRIYEAYHKTIKDNISRASLSNSEGDQIHTIHDGESIKVKEFGIDKFLVYDKYKRASLIDHFFAVDIKLEDCMFNHYDEKGDFVKSFYSAEIDKNSIILKRFGKVYGLDFFVSKTFTPTKNGYKVFYQIKNNSKNNCNICFAPEQIFALSSRTEQDLASLNAVDIWKRKDDHLKIEAEIVFSEKIDLFVYPIETVSNSDDGYERTYQGTVVVPLMRKTILPNETKEFSFETNVYGLVKSKL
ncbi:MAG: DUF1926 domain-containing protein [Elusimicrobiota bacterium]|jgi:alpha-amylase|nr:DUF1926 domain-containing protein [Elusimicrobiota bacterium]